MIGHGSKKGSSLRMLALLAGKETFEGKRCECGETKKHTGNCKCVNCHKSKEANNAKQGD